MQRAGDKGCQAALGCNCSSSHCKPCNYKVRIGDPVKSVMYFKIESRKQFSIAGHEEVQHFTVLSQSNHIYYCIPLCYPKPDRPQTCILSVLTVTLIKKIVAVVMCDFTFTFYPVFVSLYSIHIVHYFISERIVDYLFFSCCLCDFWVLMILKWQRKNINLQTAIFYVYVKLQGNIKMVRFCCKYLFLMHLIIFTLLWGQPKKDMSSSDSLNLILLCS